MAAGNSPPPDEADGGMIVDINVTPLVDITLVLLIIFMVTAPFIQPALRVELPKAKTGDETVKSTLALELGKDGKLSLNGSAASEADVKAFIQKTLPEKPDLQAVIAADKSVPHGQVVHIIDLVREMGVRKFAMSVESQR